MVKGLKYLYHGELSVLMGDTVVISLLMSFTELLNSNCWKKRVNGNFIGQLYFELFQEGIKPSCKYVSEGNVDSINSTLSLVLKLALSTPDIFCDQNLYTKNLIKWHKFKKLLNLWRDEEGSEINEFCLKES